VLLEGRPCRLLAALRLGLALLWLLRLLALSGAAAVACGGQPRQAGLCRLAALRGFV
jgi:hypothetical protein